MSRNYYTTRLQLALILLLSLLNIRCSTDEECFGNMDDPLYFDNCSNPSQPTPEELQIMRECRENRSTDTTYLKNHVLGTWKLVGQGMSWGYDPKQPKEYSDLEIALDSSQVSLIYLSRSGEVDSIAQFDYSVKLNPSFSELRAQIETDTYVRDLVTISFCEEYAYYDHRASDGAFKIFQKEL